MEVASGHEEIVRREEIRTVVGLLENSGAISRIVGQHKSGELDVIGRDGDGSGSIPRWHNACSKRKAGRWIKFSYH